MLVNIRNERVVPIAELKHTVSEGQCEGKNGAEKIEGHGQYELFWWKHDAACDGVCDSGLWDCLEGFDDMLSGEDN